MPWYDFFARALLTPYKFTPHHSQKLGRAFCAAKPDEASDFDFLQWEPCVHGGSIPPPRNFQGTEQTRTVPSSLGAGAIAGVPFPPRSCPFSFGLAGLKEHVVYVCILCWDLKSGHTMCSTMCSIQKRIRFPSLMGMLMSKLVLKNLFLIQNFLLYSWASSFSRPRVWVIYLAPARDSSFLSNKVS